MSTEILIFTENSDLQSRKIELVPFPDDLLRKIKQDHKVSVCLANSSGMTLMKKDALNFVYKGIKHPKKQLTYYFKNMDRGIEFIDGTNYKVFGQLKRSINDFISNSVQSGCHGIFFICISEAMFTDSLNKIITTTRISEVKRGNYHNPLLNLIKPTDSIDLSRRYIGNSEPCLLVRQMISIASQKDFPVLVMGETGTGKEVVARTIHEYSKRSAGPFIAINCGAISPELFESELFGYKQGSFTDAKRDKKGIWELANRGTLFLDEIGDLPLYHQVKILRVIDNGEILPVGGTSTVKVNVRIIAATNKNIDTLSQNKKTEFREDLYYRISTFIIRTPPLSSHIDDIPELAEKIWSDLCNKKLTVEVLNQLKYLNWPGNVRSLKYFLERLHAIFGNDTITRDHIRVLVNQDLETCLKSATSQKFPVNQQGEKDFEKTLTMIEYLLKASIYSTDSQKRRELLENAKECLEELI